MTSLYKRATPSQRQIMRMVEGAVRNVAHVHPAWNLPATAARSIAKRAAGTLTAQWPDVLAAKSSTPSDRAGQDRYVSSRPLPAHLAKRSERGPLHRSKRSPLYLLRRQLGIMAGEARRAEKTERFDALADALRTLASVAPPEHPEGT